MADDDEDAALRHMIVDDVGAFGSDGGNADGMDAGASDDDEPIDREAIFLPAVQSLVAALGGFEDVPSSEGSGGLETVYRPGDSALAVLRDLKRLWRRDDTDDERSVARCFAKAGLARELMALMEECAERGEQGRKMALAAGQCGGGTSSWDSEREEADGRVTPPTPPRSGPPRGPHVANRRCGRAQRTRG